MSTLVKCLLILALFALAAFLIHMLVDWTRRDERPLSGPADGARAYVEKVVDGDTVKVRLLDGGPGLTTVRVLGIDCPESHVNPKCERDGKSGRRGCDWQVPRGREAARKAAGMLKHRTVVLQCGGRCRRGRFGRALRYVKLEDGRDFGLEMVRRGLCEDFGFRYPHPRRAQYTRAQERASDSGRGIWSK